MSAMPSTSRMWPAAFADLVAGAQGRHPIELLDDLQADPSPDAQRLAAEARGSPLCPPVLPQGNGLALPHPLDAEWRFSEDTARALLERAVAATQRGDAVLLLGVPTVVLAAAESDADRRFCVACEENIIGAGLAQRTASDRRVEPRDPATVYAAAIVDPPWYPTIFASLLGQAAGACRQGGLIFASAPPLGVRPTSAAERVELQAHSADLGLVLIRLSRRRSPTARPRLRSQQCRLLASTLRCLRGEGVICSSSGESSSAGCRAYRRSRPRSN